MTGLLEESTMIRHFSLLAVSLMTFLISAPSPGPSPGAVAELESPGTGGGGIDGVPCEISDVTGQTREAAEAAIRERLGRNAAIEATPDRFPSYVVTYKVDNSYGCRITLYLGTNVPNLKDLSRKDAETTLSDFGFDKDPQPAEGGMDWTVTSQDPPAGTLSAYNTRVRFDLVDLNTPTPKISPSPPSPRPPVTPVEVTSPTPLPGGGGNGGGGAGGGGGGGGDPDPTNIAVTNTGSGSGLGPLALGGAVLVVVLLGLVFVPRALRTRPAPAGPPAPPPRPAPLRQDPPRTARSPSIHCVAHPDPAPRLEIHVTGVSRPPAGPPSRAASRLPDIRVETHPDPGHQELREVRP
jgi:hypothetical protein